MASVPPDPVPLLVTLKAVDPVGISLLRRGAARAGDEPCSRRSQGDSAVVAEEFLIRLNAHVGQTLRLGGKNFQNRSGAQAGAGPHHAPARAWGRA